MKNFINLDFKALPRFYQMILFAKIIRIYRIHKMLPEILKKTNFLIDIQELILTFIKMVILLHLIANFWATSSKLDLYSDNSWVIASGVENESTFE